MATELKRKAPRKPRKYKDKSKPKRGKSAYLFFSMTQRGAILAKQPDLKVTEVAKVVAGEWRKLTPQEKVPYEEMAAADRARYQKEMETYVPVPDPNAAKNSRRRKDPNAPKRPKAAFMVFSAHVRPKIKEQFPDEPFGAVAKRIGAMWQQLSDEMKKPFVAEAEADKARYRREKAIFDAGNAGGGSANHDDDAHASDDDDEVVSGDDVSSEEEED